MTGLAYVCLGGALGSGCRYLITQLAVRHLGGGFPYGTLAVNLIGCFAIALILELAATVAVSTHLRLFLTTGVLGGPTTYSSFNYEASRMIHERASASAVAYLGATLLGCFVAGVLGLLAARRLVG